MNNFDDDTKTAFCQACTLASIMKDCPRCQFNVGLVFKTLEAVKRNEMIDQVGLDLLQARRETLGKV